MTLRDLHPAEFQAGDRIHTDKYGIVTLIDGAGGFPAFWLEFETEEVGDILFSTHQTHKVERNALTRDDVKRLAYETYMGIIPEDRDTMLDLTMKKVIEAQLNDAVNDAEKIVEIMQDVGATCRFSTVED